ncbi:hypothetical protein AUW26_26720 [Streptomyces sp. CC71]|nr:hypothetical protein AUW26_26720 [Streptomyces sp. CC71]
MSVRRTSVLTKKPTRFSVAPSVRPATGVPIGMSSPAPSRVSSAASAACTTMNVLECVLLASSVSRAYRPASSENATRSPSWSATAGRGRSVGSSNCSGSPASRSFQWASCRPAALSASASSPRTYRCHSA